MKGNLTDIENIIAENSRRNEVIDSPFCPVTGRGSIGERVEIRIPDFAIPSQFVPVELIQVPFVKKLLEAGSLRTLVSNLRTAAGLSSQTDIEADVDKASETLIRIRLKYDFPFWAATLVKIKNKDAGDDVLFRLRRPQRILVERFEQKRRAGLPIRLVLLKARQWGGSTTTQLYMAWLQLFHLKGLNSLIIAHQGSASDEIKDMFDRMLKAYPLHLLYAQGEKFSPSDPKLVAVGKSGSTHRIPQRNCKIKIGTAERPDGCRGGDYSLVHLSEVGIWKKTEGKSPEDIVRSACSGILLRPFTMIVMESTANGTGNFFHSEYVAAADPDTPSQFDALFIPWFQIEQYSLPFKSDSEKKAFAKTLFDGRLSDSPPSSRQESGRYLWSLWLKGATLEAINWYIMERAGKNDHAVMASEFPSDPIEAFVHSGSLLFDPFLVDAFRPECRHPSFIGEISADADAGRDALKNLHFSPDPRGLLYVWNLPEPQSADEAPDFIADRYLTVVDIGGRSEKADFSVVVVFDRLDMIDGDRPAVVAQWYGHCDADRLAWKAAQIAAFYQNSLLVIESNTLETRDRDRFVDGDQSLFILNQISAVYQNLYARRQSEDEIRQRLPRKYGFHTNIATKPMIISSLVKVVRDHLYIERDARCLNEFLTYERKPNGAFGAIVGRHDDLLMTRAIGLHICFNEMPLPRIIPRSPRSRTKNRGPVSEAAF